MFFTAMSRIIQIPDRILSFRFPLEFHFFPKKKSILRIVTPCEISHFKLMKVTDRSHFGGLR